jgi:hypothetical protein
MTDTTPATTAIAAMIAAGTTESELLVRVMRQFPDLTPAEFSVALQAGMAAAERKVLRPQPNPARGRALLAHWRRIKPRRH